MLDWSSGIKRRKRKYLKRNVNKPIIIFKFQNKQKFGYHCIFNSRTSIFFLLWLKTFI